MKTLMVGMLALAFAASAAFSVRAVNAQERAAAVFSDEEIARALKPSVSKTRGLARRSDTPQGPPSINLNIAFKYNSSSLAPAASDQLRQLELALVSNALAKDRFVVVGHTDSKGNALYNKQLSLKRAESVRRFLVAHGVDTGRLDAVGYGSEQPLLPQHPEDPSNRRVEIRELGPAH